MKTMIVGASLALAALAVPVAATAAAGTPQRSDAIPPGLAKKLADPTQGLLRALIATMESNSRLQDLPVSP